MIGISAIGVILGVIGLVLVGALFIRCTLKSNDQVRRMRWRVMFRLRPGPGFATAAEIWLRWGRLAAMHYGRLSRPSMSRWQRWTSRTTEYAVRLGRGPYYRRMYASLELAMLLLAPPRKGKTGFLGDRLIDHPGAALVHEAMRPDLYFGTAGYRNETGPVQTFNPDKIGGIPSTFRWAMTSGCEDPAEAVYRAADLVGAIAEGEMQWWAEKARGALAAGVHAAGLVSDSIEAKAALGVAAGIQAASLLNGDMGDVWAWAFGDKTLIEEAAGHPLMSRPLLGALTELDRPGKTADSIKITMSKSLEWLAIPSLRDMVTGPDAAPFNVPEFIDSCGTIYMISPGPEAPSAPLTRCFTSYVHRKAKAYAQIRDPDRRRLDPGLLFALDELDKCPVALPLWLADSGGSGIQVVAVVHSTGQLKDKYGEAGVDTVMSTTGLKVFLGGNHHVRTLKDISELCGTLPKGEQYENPVAPINFVTRLPRRYALVINDDLTPVVVRLRPFWKRTAIRLHRAPALPVLRPVAAAQAQRVPVGVTANGNGNGHGHAVLHNTAPWPAAPANTGPGASPDDGDSA
jgi:type IV secretion system protein VirD4